MKSGRFLVLAGVLVFGVGCAPRYLLYSEAKFPGLGLKGGLGLIRIEDTREDLRKIHVSFLNPDQATLFKSPLDSLDSSAISGQLKRHWSGRGNRYSVNVRVDEAQVGYQVFFWHADEFSKTKVTLQAYSGNAKVAECSGNAELQRRSQKASEKSMKSMFDEALELSVYKCLEAIRPQLGGAGIEETDPGKI